MAGSTAFCAVKSFFTTFWVESYSLLLNDKLWYVSTSNQQFLLYKLEIDSLINIALLILLAVMYRKSHSKVSP